MPSTFISDLRERADTFDRTVRRRRIARVESTTARRDVAAAVKRGFEAITTLDLVLTNAHPDKTVELETWKRARHVDGRRRRATRHAAEV